jgi:hypothetical protein
MLYEWYSVDTPEAIERLTGVWRGAPTDVVEIAAMLAEVSAAQVWEFAPESFDPESENGERLPLPDEAPARLVYAQLMQMQNNWNADRANETGQVGPDGQPQFMFQPRPMDKTIRSFIRPQSGVINVY